jgi:hypothetical protein
MVIYYSELLSFLYITFLEKVHLVHLSQSGSGKKSTLQVHPKSTQSTSFSPQPPGIPFAKKEVIAPELILFAPELFLFARELILFARELFLNIPLHCWGGSACASGVITGLTKRSFISYQNGGLGCFLGGK